MGQKRLTESEIVDQHGRGFSRPTSQIIDTGALRMLDEYSDKVIYAAGPTHYSKFCDLLESIRANGNKLKEGQILEFAGTILVENGKGGLVKKNFDGVEQLREARKQEHLVLRESTSTFTTQSTSAYATDNTAFDNEYAPLMAGPWSKQMYLADMLTSMSRCFYERTHNPVAKRCLQITRHFVLGRGVKVKCVNKKAQRVWDDFESANDLTHEMKMWHDDLRSDGELFLRFFPSRARKPLVVLPLDASTIWEIVTDPENLRQVHYYHQQYQTPYQLYATGNIEAMRYILRQIPAEEVVHLKINCSSHEKRGRSDFYPGLTYFKMLRDYVAAKAVKAKLQASFVWDLLIKGMTGDVSLADLALPDPEHPGTYWMHNEMMTLTPQSSNVGTGSGRNDNIFYDILTLIALGIGIPKEFLGTSDSGGTRASAVLASEPGTKFFEDAQQDVEWLYQKIADKVFAYAKSTGQLSPSIDTGREIIFPEIAAEEVLKKIKALGQLEADEVLSHETASQMKAAEVRISTYDYAAERAIIKKEKIEGDYWLHKDNAMVQKWTAAKAGPEAPKAEPEGDGSENIFGSGGAELKNELKKESQMFARMMKFREAYID